MLNVHMRVCMLDTRAKLCCSDAMTDVPQWHSMERFISRWHSHHWVFLCFTDAGHGLPKCIGHQTVVHFGCCAIRAPGPLTQSLA